MKSRHPMKHCQMKHCQQILIGSVTLLTLSCLTSSVTADVRSKDEASIRSEIQKMDQAADNRNVDGYIAFTHPDFVNIAKNGKETNHGKEERKQKFSQLFANATQVRQQTTVTHIIFSKQGATADKVSNNFMILTRNGQTIELKGSGTYRDFWVKSTGVWIQKRSRTIAENTTINGQPVP